MSVEFLWNLPNTYADMSSQSVGTNHELDQNKAEIVSRIVLR